MKLMLNEGFAGASIALADRFIQPTDDVGEKKVLFKLPIRPNGQLAGGPRLETSRWYSVELAWDLDTSRCRVLVDGEPAVEFAQSHDDCAGVSYLRLRSTADMIDPAGLLVEQVHAKSNTLAEQ